jgi:hypothetical protein
MTTMRGTNKILRDILSLNEDQTSDTYIEDRKYSSDDHQYPEDNSGDIVFNSRRTQILGGTLDKIIEIITSEAYQGLLRPCLY